MLNKELGIFWLLVTYSISVIQGLQVRLVGDSTNGTGRLEILYKGQWNAVSSGRLTENDLKAVCRTLGFGNSGIAVELSKGYAGVSVYGLYSGLYTTDSFNCLGNETDISQCGLNYLYSYTVKNSPSMATVSCAESQIRLVDGDSASSGRVEIYIKDGWHTICDTNFDRASAKVVCSMLGYKDTGIAVPILYSSFGQGYGDAILSGLACTGNEKDIKECGGRWGTGSCTHRNDAGVRCGGTPIRLVNGPDPSAGRVEIQHAGEWGTICGNSQFDHRDVMVICRMLGYNNTRAFGFLTPFYGEGTGTVIAKDPVCDGSESDIAQCSSLQWNQPGHTRLCSHSNDIGVNCNGRTKIRLADGYSDKSGRLEVYHNGHWGTVSSQGFDNHDLMVVCRSLGFEYSENSFFTTQPFFGYGLGEIVVGSLDCNGNEHDIGECTASWMPTYTQGHDYDVGVSCDGHIPIRLVGGATNATGRVEIMHNGYYGTVCSEDFDRADLAVMCRMLGFENIPSTAYWRTGAYFGQGLGEIAVSGLKCNGIESTIGKCGGNWPADKYYCDSHYKDVTISCDGSSEKLRLVGGSTNFTGRVEILHNGQWGKICEQDFDRPDAVVICRALGFPKPLTRVDTFWAPGMALDYKYLYPLLENKPYAFAKTKTLISCAVTANLGPVLLNVFRQNCSERAIAYRNPSIPNGNSTAIVTNLRCNGAENTLEQCVANWYPSRCSFGYDAAVNCCPSCTATQVIG